MQPSCVNSVRRLLVPVALGILLTGCGGLDFPIQKGEDLALQGRWEESVQVFREANKKDPQNLEARLGLARALWAASMEQVRLGEELEQSDRPEDAQTAYRRALGYNGENQLALVGLERIGRAGEIRDRLARARQRIAKKEWRAAQSEVQAVLRLDPDKAKDRPAEPKPVRHANLEGLIDDADPRVKWTGTWLTGSSGTTLGASCFGNRAASPKSSFSL